MCDIWKHRREVEPVVWAKSCQRGKMTLLAPVFTFKGMFAYTVNSHVANRDLKSYLTMIKM